MIYDTFPSVAPPLARLIGEFNKLPGIGPKSAQRLSYYLIRMPIEDATALSEAILGIKHLITLCTTCQNITEENPCYICSHENRDRTRICVVEEPLDVLSIERTRAYEGLYHVLHGVISPARGIGPEQLKIQELLTRIDTGQIKEIILATNSSLEGENTSMRLQNMLANKVPRITRLARGLPVGSDLEYADQITLSRAIEGRQDVD